MAAARADLGGPGGLRRDRIDERADRRTADRLEHLAEAGQRRLRRVVQGRRADRGRTQLDRDRGVLDVGQDAPLVINIEGDDLGILIGRRAETLAAIQYLTRLMVNHKTHRWINLVVDVEGYKARREDQLVKLAERMADRAATTGKSVTLEAMPARERRIIHITLRDHPKVYTESAGEGEHRKVTIIPKS